MKSSVGFVNGREILSWAPGSEDWQPIPTFTTLNKVT